MMKEGQKMIEVLVQVLYDVASGKLITFDVVRSKPYVRTPKRNPDDHCSLYRELDTAHLNLALTKFQKAFPEEKTAELADLARACSPLSHCANIWPLIMPDLKNKQLQ